jgi:hypothetical protein
MWPVFGPDTTLDLGLSIGPNLGPFSISAGGRPIEIPIFEVTEYQRSIAAVQDYAVIRTTDRYGEGGVLVRSETEVVEEFTSHLGTSFENQIYGSLFGSEPILLGTTSTEVY